MKNNIYGNNSIVDQDKTYRIIAMISHLISLFSAPLGPMVIWLIMRNENLFAEEHSRKSFNWQISLILYTIVAGVLCLVLVGYLVLAFLAVWNIGSIIFAAIAAYQGRSFNYILALPLLR